MCLAKLCAYLVSNKPDGRVLMIQGVMLYCIVV